MNPAYSLPISASGGPSQASQGQYISVNTINSAHTTLADIYRFIQAVNTAGPENGGPGIAYPNWFAQSYQRTEYGESAYVTSGNGSAAQWIVFGLIGFIAFLALRS